jgi:hypothetical protein
MPIVLGCYISFFHQNINVLFGGKATAAFAASRLYGISIKQSINDKTPFPHLII